jgi:CHASE3 domain sensor protein
MTLARRMWLASVALAFIVVAAFVALIVAIGAQREATAREARSRDVTAASLRLEKLVVDMETGIRGLTLTNDRSFL